MTQTVFDYITMMTALKKGNIDVFAFHLQIYMKESIDFPYIEKNKDLTTEESISVGDSP